MPTITTAEWTEVGIGLTIFVIGWLAAIGVGIWIGKQIYDRPRW